MGSLAVLAALLALLSLAQLLGRPRRLWWWWRARRPETTISLIAAALFGLLVAVPVIGGAFLFLTHESFGWLDNRCHRSPVGCNVVANLSVTLFLATTAFFLFVAWRRRRIAGYYRSVARRTPDQLFRTSVSLDAIVPRDPLVRSIADDICRVKHRRPHLLLGGVGTGKTTTMVSLTRWLAERGAVPVPLQLAGLREPVDFLALARAEFLRTVDGRLSSQDDGDRIWRRLCREGAVVVLADSLERTRTDLTGAAWRAGLTGAVDSANSRNIPLVIASRGRQELDRLDVATSELEALAEDDAIAYIEREHPVTSPEDREQLAHLVNTGQLAETPFYLNLAADLHSVGALLPRPDAVTRRLLVRVALFDRYVSALVDRQLAHASPLMSEERRTVVATLEVVALHSFITKQRVRVNVPHDAPLSPHGDLWDPDLALDSASALGLADPVATDSLEFRHSILQSYLASRLLARVLAAKDTVTVQRVAEGRTRDSYMALTMAVARAEDRRSTGKLVIDVLLDVAEADPGGAKLWLATAAADVAQVVGVEDIGDADVSRITKCAGAALSLTEERLPKVRILPRLKWLRTQAGYEAMWQLCHDDDYAVRLSAALTTAEGGDIAYEYLQPIINGAFEDARTTSTSGGSYTVRDLGLQGWITPTLAMTSGTHARRELLPVVDGWADLAAAPLHPAIEASIAKGLKLAASRVVPESDYSTRDALWDITVTKMLPRARFWYARIALYQAVCLWAVASEALIPAAKRVLAEAQRTERHPFVAEAASLCFTALSKCDWGKPPPRRDVSSYVWFDEIAVVGSVGGAGGPAIGGSYWADFLHGTLDARVGTATTWTNLAPGASRLIADVVVLLNLVEQGDTDAERRSRLERSSGDAIPHCVSDGGKRSRLRVERATPQDAPRGSECSCGLHLCPYPSRSEVPYRAEMSEAFCRHQRQLLGLPRRTAPWQSGRPKHMREFWAAMERRPTL